MGEEDKSVCQKDETQELMLRYLSGELSDDEQSRIEEKFFADEHYFEQMLAAEDGLIDDFVQGRLSPSEREKFDRFLRSSPYESCEIDFVKELIKNVEEAGPPEPDQSGRRADTLISKLQSLLVLTQRRFPSRQLSFAALILGILSIPFIIWNLTLQRKIRNLELERVALEQKGQQLEKQIIEQRENNLILTEKAENEQNLRSQIERELDDLTQSIPRIARVAVAHVLLTTESITRGTTRVPTVHLQPETRQLKIDIDLETSDNYKDYSAVIMTFDGRRVWTTNEIREHQSNSHRRVLVLPAKIFSSDDYILTLRGEAEGSGFIDLRDYSFRVRR